LDKFWEFFTAGMSLAGVVIHPDKTYVNEFFAELGG